jgi:LL-H family phage holin
MEDLIMNETLFNVLLGLIPVLATIITGFVIPFIISKLGTEKLSTIVKWVGYAVGAAEMIFNAEGMGTDKKQYVINFINKLFNSKKVVITEEQIEVLIEAAVNELNKIKE